MYERFYTNFIGVAHKNEEWKNGRMKERTKERKNEKKMWKEAESQVADIVKI